MSERRFSDSADIDEFIAVLEQYERGEITEDVFRAFRLSRGVYGQRQDGVQMLRVKIPQGILQPEQLDALAEVAEQAPRKLAHVTTRQNLQFHFLPMDRLEGLMRRLDEVGVTTREACGNTVRNVTGCGKAGLCPEEAFDPTPFGDAIVRHLLRNPIAGALPRKFKIALSGCKRDCALGAINDIGLIAHRAEDGSRRFTVLAGGGLSTLPTSGFVLEESFPAEEILSVVEALVRLFDKTGDRKNRQKARMKFVIRRLGREGFVALYQEALEEVRRLGQARPLAIPDPGPSEVGAGWSLPPVANPKLRTFIRTNVTQTRSIGRVFVSVRLDVGDVSATQLRGLAAIARSFGDGTVRTTVGQNLLLRDVAAGDLFEIHRALDALGLAAPDADSSADVTSCPGADTCKIAITNARDLAKSLAAALGERPLAGADIKLSGCPNSCGQHQIGALGFHGAVRKIGGRAAPHYQVLAGGGVDASGARFGRVLGKVPARRVRETIERLLAHAGAQKDREESAADYFRRAELGALKAVIADLLDLGAAASEEDFIDLGAETPFRVVTAAGECAA